MNPQQLKKFHAWAKAAFEQAAADTAAMAQPPARQKHRKPQQSVKEKTVQMERQRQMFRETT